MAGGSMQVTGIASLQKRLMRAKNAAPSLLHAATAEAIAFLQEKAKQILDAEVYDKSRPEYAAPLDKEEAGSLWSSFVQEIVGLSGIRSEGRLGNESPHAIFLEFGTDDEGTGEHFIPVVNGKALHWIDGATGEGAFDGKGHMVHGIHPIRFMSRALHEHTPEVIAIFRRHLGDFFDEDAGSGKKQWTISLPT